MGVLYLHSTKIIVPMLLCLMFLTLPGRIPLESLDANDRGKGRTITAHYDTSMFCVCKTIISFVIV